MLDIESELGGNPSGLLGLSGLVGVDLTFGLGEKIGDFGGWARNWFLGDGRDGLFDDGGKRRKSGGGAGIPPLKIDWVLVSRDVRGCGIALSGGSSASSSSTSSSLDLSTATTTAISTSPSANTELNTNATLEIGTGTGGEIWNKQGIIIHIKSTGLRSGMFYRRITNCTFLLFSP